MKGKYLITTTDWFYAPDGKTYNAAWGEVAIIEDSILGIKTNRNSSNWFVKMGNDEKHIIIAGCRIHYAIKCEERPNTNDNIISWTTDTQDGIKFYKRPCVIYIAE